MTLLRARPCSLKSKREKVGFSSARMRKRAAEGKQKRKDAKKCCSCSVCPDWPEWVVRALVPVPYERRRQVGSVGRVSRPALGQRKLRYLTLAELSCLAVAPVDFCASIRRVK